MKPPSPPAATRSAQPRPSTATPPPTPPSNLPKHLRKAAGAKDPTVLPAFIANHPLLTLTDLDDTSYDGRGPLHMACWTGAISNVELLLERGCNINAIATRSHNYGKSPIFFACTRSREDVVRLLLDRGANVLIVNNKGQSVWSIARSHFGKGVVERIQEVELAQQREWSESNPGGGNLGWVDYHKTHPDGCVYGDLDLRFLGRPLTEDDVVEDGVVNPTTKESRRGNFARNNPQAYNSRKKKEGKATKTKQPEPAIITEDERMQLEKYWENVHTALKAGDAWGLHRAIASIVQLMEAKKVRSKWVVECASRLESMVDSSGDDTPQSPIDFEAVLSEATVFCGSGDRHATLVKRILANAGEASDQSNSINEGIDRASSLTDRERISSGALKPKTKPALPDQYHSALDSLRASINEGGSAPSWAVLMNAQLAGVDGEKRHLSLPHPPTWVDSSNGLQNLRSKLNNALNESDLELDTDEISFERMVAFDSEFRSENGRTALATIQVSVLEEGVPLAWVVDLHPDPADAIYATSTCDFLRWLFLESDAHLLGFAHRHDLHMISSYIEEDIQASSLRLWDLQLLAAHKMSGAGGSTTSLPGLKSLCAYFLGAAETAWELSKAEQCSNWARRPLTKSQLEYAGLDAAVLLVLMAEICRRTK